MNRILMTTALVGLMAAPAAADNHNTGASAQWGGLDINASTLIDKDIYMPREGGMAMDGSSDRETTDMQEDMARSETMEQDGDTETMQGDMARSEEMEQDSDTVTMQGGTARSETMEEDGTAGSMQTDTAQSGSGTMQGNLPDDSENQMDMAEGVTEVPDTWQRVGEIDDVIFSESGEVRALLVDAGGFLGMGEEQKRIEMSSLQFVSDSDDEGRYYVVFNGDRSLFEDQDNYDATSSRGAGEMRASDNDDMPSPDSRIEERVDWASLTTEDLLGIAVYGTNDNWLGDLSELNLTEGGEIEGAVIDVGGFLGIGEKPVAMEMSQIDFRRTSGGDLRAYVSATETELENMPEWTGEDS